MRSRSGLSSATRRVSLRAPVGPSDRLKLVTVRSVREGALARSRHCRRGPPGRRPLRASSGFDSRAPRSRSWRSLRLYVGLLGTSAERDSGHRPGCPHCRHPGQSLHGAGLPCSWIRWGSSRGDRSCDPVSTRPPDRLDVFEPPVQGSSVMVGHSAFWSRSVSMARPGF